MKEPARESRRGRWRCERFCLPIDPKIEFMDCHAGQYPPSMVDIGRYSWPTEASFRRSEGRILAKSGQLEDSQGLQYVRELRHRDCLCSCDGSDWSFWPGWPGDHEVGVSRGLGPEPRRYNSLSSSVDMPPSTSHTFVGMGGMSRFGQYPRTIPSLGELPGSCGQARPEELVHSCDGEAKR